MQKNLEIHLEGNALSRGIAIGQAYVLDSQENCKVLEVALAQEDIEGEIQRYRDALCAAREELLQLKVSLEQEGIKDGASILEAHVQLTVDPLLTIEIEEAIRKSAKNAESVLIKVMRHYAKKFKK